MTRRYLNSEVPCVANARTLRAKAECDNAKRAFYGFDTFQRYEARKPKLAERRRRIRAANRRWLQDIGMPFKNA